MVATIKATVIFWGAFGFGLVHCQETQESCGYGAGSMAAAVVLTFICTVLLVGALLYFLKKREAKKDNHLILETDPESGKKAEYAFDNPGFAKDTTLISTNNEKYPNKPDSASKTKWGNWSPFTALNLKPEKKRALDDSAIQNHEVKVVALKSQDFTGLGFTICGNMKEGIYIKDILHRGPAFESGKLNTGDRINSVTISFEHMVYEDAMNILSYASPYEVIIEAKSGRILSYQQGQGQTPVHPIYRSSSSVDLSYPSSRKRLFADDYSSSSNYSSLQKSRSNVTTLERKESKSPRPKSKKPEKVTPESLKTHLEHTINEEHLKIELQQTENRGQKFGVRVLPVDLQQKSPKIVEQNQNNANIERSIDEEVIPPIRSIDEVDRLVPPQVKKREKKSPEPNFERNGSGIRRDVNGIPLEIPDHMQDAAMVARRNRKSSTDNGLTNGEDHGRKPGKGKAPGPPVEEKLNFNLGAIKSRAFEDLSNLVAAGASDSEDEANNLSSVNTIELNSSDITIHQSEEEEHKSRKTASTGDLTKMKKTPRSRSGTLERAQSLDITDTSGPGLSKKRTHDATENLLIDREPRLSLILDGLTTFQRNKLKTSTEWGNLEDAILNAEERRKSEPQFNAVMDRVMQIKREEVELPEEVVKQYQQTKKEVPKVLNKLWPDEEDINFQNSGWKKIEAKIVPTVPERTKLKINEETLPPQPAERISKIDLVEPSGLSVEYECIKPTPPKRERTPEKETIINLNHKFLPPVTSFEKNNISEMCSQIAKGRNGEGQMIKDEWEDDALNNTSPPPSLMEEVMDSFNKNYGNTVVLNLPDETKEIEVGNLKNLTANFLINERIMDTNIPDDVKVSRGSYESLEAKKPELIPKCDDAKSEDLMVSHVNGGSNLHSLELSINDGPNELYSDVSNDVTVIISKPNQVTVKKIETSGEPLVEITESSFSILTKDIPVNVSETKLVKVGEGSHGDDFKVEITESKYSTFEVDKPQLEMLTKAVHLEEPLIDDFKGIEDESPAMSLTEDPDKKTYVTEIQVQVPEDPLENAFEDYVKNFEKKLENFESNMQNFENNLEEFIRDEPKSIVLEEKSDVEKQASKIQEIAEEQLKTLPEMRFTTSSYESGGRKTPEKRHSFELLRSNFEKASNESKSPPRRDSNTPTKSRIPIATTMKTPPMSPERRDSRNLENEHDKAILELMSSSTIHSTPFASKIKPPGSKNVSVTSIKQNSKIPSGLPTLSSRPPIPPRKSEDNGIAVSSNGGMESSFKQWVFNPNNNVTNVTVGKEK